LEWICRQELQREPNVEIRPRRRVSALSPSADLDAVTGVQFDQDGAVGTIPADLIIDASGRAAPTLSFLEATGRTKPSESEIGIDMAYGSVIFEPPSDRPDWKLVNHLAAKPQGLRSGVIAPLEGERWIITLMGAHGDGPPNDLDGFRAFAKSLRAPTIYNAIEGAKPLSDIIRFNLPSSLMRHFDKVERFPRGLIPLGDSICRFNPVFGQGMSVAAQQAVALRHILESRRAEADPLAGLADAFFAEARATVETPWAVAMSDLAYPQTRGERPADFAQRMQFQARLQRLMIEDPTVQKVVTEVNHLVRPRSALRDPELVERVRAAPLS
jgi:2-polyprenyl-6-methoxyphenol hydroxylase-like FAD-dependent oxidoreductase